MKRILLLLGLWAALMSPAVAAERIDTFTSEVVIAASGALTVTETIAVTAEGNQIRRGIYRDFPTRYDGPFSLKKEVPFDLVSVSRDGRDESYRLENISRGIRLYIGDPDIFLPKGAYTYTIVYRTDFQLGYFDDYDELYWDVTGNDWEFPIIEATVRIVPPPAVPWDVLEVTGFTGEEGSTKMDYVSSISGNGLVEATTTRTLAKAEGFTIVLRWPKGYVYEPTAKENLTRGLATNADAGVGALGFILVLLYYLFTWWKIGKDPKKGTIIPHYTPPPMQFRSGPSTPISPAGARYVMRRQLDTKAMSAAVLSMAVQGAIVIHEEKKFIADKYSISRGSEAAREGLAPEEKKLFSAFFARSHDTFAFEQSNHAVMGRAKKAFEKSLKRQFQKKAFFLNRRAFWIGVVLSVFVVLVSGLAAGSVRTGDFAGPFILLPLGFILVWASMWVMVLAAIVQSLLTRVAVFRSASGFGQVTTFFSMIGTGLLSLVLLVPQVMAIFFISEFASVAVAGLVVVLLLANAAAYFLLQAPTREGRELMDKVEGFSMFLSITQKDRLAFHTPSRSDRGEKGEVPPKMTFDLFNKYLPYALALGIEHAWAQQFSEQLLQAQKAGDPYAPMWYVGANWGDFHTGNFASSFGSALTSAIASSSSAPGSSSGFSGGSSGGGGGGGGGGGW